MRKILLILCVFTFANAQKATVQKVEDFPTVGSSIQYDDSDDIWITSEVFYPTPYVLNNLFLSGWKTAEQLKYWKTKVELKKGFFYDESGLNFSQFDIIPIVAPKISADDSDEALILSIGEGSSGLVPFLVEKFKDENVRIEGIDLWYDEGLLKNASEFELNHFHHYKENLKKGDAGDLSRYANDSVDLILAHYLYCHLPEQTKIDFIKESIRILKKGGSLRVNCMGEFKTRENLKTFVDKSLKLESKPSKIGIFKYTSGRKINIDPFLKEKYHNQNFSIILEHHFLEDVSDSDENIVFKSLYPHLAPGNIKLYADKIKETYPAYRMVFDFFEENNTAYAAFKNLSTLNEKEKVLLYIEK